MKRKSLEDLKSLFLQEINSCVKCGNCLAFCPIYRRRKGESVSMRGKIAVLQSMDQGTQIPEKKVSEVLGTCFSCQTCKVLCPNGLNTDIVKILGRFFQIPDGQAVRDIDLRRFLLREQFEETRLTSSINSISWFSQLRKIKSDWKLAGQIDESSLTAENVIFIDGHVYQDRGQVEELLEITKTLSGGPIGTFPLDFQGYSLLMTGNLPLLELHLSDFFRAAAAFEARKFFVVSPESWFFLQKIGLFYDFDPQEKELLDRFCDVFAWLQEEIDSIDPKIGGSWTIHDPCLLTRGLGMRQPYRKLMKKLFEAPPVELKREGACCGGQADLREIDEEDLKAIGDERIGEIVKLEVDRVVAACPTCCRMLGASLTESAPRMLPLISAIYRLIRKT